VFPLKLINQLYTKKELVYLLEQQHDMSFIKKVYTDGFFKVGHQHGFLPEKMPLTTLPSKYSELQDILNKMPVKIDGNSGYLDYPGKIHEEVKSLKNYHSEVKNENDIMLVQALYRGYCFLASAYTLEPSFQHFRKTGNYGKANNVLPKQIAQPFVEVSNKLDVYPWLDYHYAYSLGNFRKLDKKGDFKWSNLDMCVRFSGQPDEVGFIMLHVDINQHSPSLVGSVINALHAIKDSDNSSAISYLKENYETMKLMNQRRREMWKASRWNHYNDFRVFIMGVKGNEELFGDGVIYKGVWSEPKQFRGQTGAQDDIIPMEDIFSGVIKHYPKNELTKYLIDLRSYRPKCIQKFFKDLEQTVSNLSKEGISDILYKQNNFEGLCYLLGVLEEIYHFRNGHWQFVQKYIMANTKYSKATGGTPIISWLPNQMKAVMNEMKNVIKLIGDNQFNNESLELFISIKKNINNKVKLLDHQLELINKKSFSAKKIFNLNKKYDLSDRKD